MLSCLFIYIFLPSFYMVSNCAFWFFIPLYLQDYPKALRNESAKFCLEPLYIECSECSFELFTALRNECCQWSGVLRCEGFVLSTDYFTLAVRDEKLFYLHFGWHNNFVKIILETREDLVSTELCKTLSGEIRQFLETTVELLRTKLQNIAGMRSVLDRKSTRLNSSHANISYAVFCLKKKKLYKQIFLRQFR